MQPQEVQIHRSKHVPDPVEQLPDVEVTQGNRNEESGLAHLRSRRGMGSTTSGTESFRPIGSLLALRGIDDDPHGTERLPDPDSSSLPISSTKERQKRSTWKTDHGGREHDSTGARTLDRPFPPTSNSWVRWFIPKGMKGRGGSTGGGSVNESNTRREIKRKKRRAKKPNLRGGEHKYHDTDVLVQMERGAEAQQRRSNQVPPEPPTPTITTADALNRAAEERRARTKGAPKLHFAPEQKRFRKRDLPADFEPDDQYRGLEEYVRQMRRTRRLSRNIRSSSSARSAGGSSKASTADSSSSSSDDGSSSSSSSSSSSASGRLTMARLRAFFGDDSSSGSASSSMSSSGGSSSSSSAGGSSSSSLGDDRNSNANSSDNSSPSPASSVGNFRMFARTRAGATALRRRSSRFSEDDAAPPLPFRSPSIAGRTDHEENPHRTRPSVALPTRTPAPFVGAFNLKGGAKRRRQRRARQRMKAQEKELVRQGKLPPRPSKKARRKAKLARAQAGGVTEFTLFTPVSLSIAAERSINSRVRPVGEDEEKADVKGLSSTKSHQNVGSDDGKILHTTSFLAVKDRLHALRRYRRQIEGAEGDLGLPLVKRQNETSRDPSYEPGKADNGADAATAHLYHDLELDLEDGDLALPPPALDLDPPTSTREIVTRSVRNRSASGAGEKDEAQTGWHMSDVPLTPHVRMASDFAQGFLASPSRRQTECSTNPHRYNADAGMIPELEDEGKQSSASGTRVETETGRPSPLGDSADQGHAAWWLDINCPTYRDMTELSKMFPLHPLTVEDVLQQDTREKVEVFESLGYYFVVIRAIDESYFRYTSSSEQGSDPAIATQESPSPHEFDAVMEMEDLTKHESGHKRVERRPQVEIVEGVGGKEGLEGVSVGAKNLYLIVFSHGVISFHFEDVSKHTDRVRSRLVDLTQPVELTSDWIAHGLFDSIVDAFFPLLSFLESEVEDLEQMTSEPLPSKRHDTADKRMVAVSSQPGARADSLPLNYGHVRSVRPELRILPRIPLHKSLARKLPTSWQVERVYVLCVNLEGLPEEPRSLIQRLFRLNRRRARVRAFLSGSAQGQSDMLRRITDVRKIVTGLSRLLAPKNDSVRGLRKRLFELRTGVAGLSRIEMSIYMGDVHDHIVTIMTHLSNGDARLSDIHFSYLSSIRINNRRVKQSTDEILVVLAAVTVTLLSCVCVAAIGGMNVEVPQNKHGSSTFHWFGGVVAIVVVIPILIAIRVRLWIKQAKQRSDARRAVR